MSEEVLRRNNVILFPTKFKGMQDSSFVSQSVTVARQELTLQERIDKIKDSVTRINQLMEQLKEKSNEPKSF